MIWNNPKSIPSDGEEIVVRATDTVGKWRYAIGVWSNEHKFILPDISCPECGSRPLFMYSGLIGTNTRVRWEWASLHAFLQLVVKNDHLLFEKQLIESKYKQCEAIMHDAVICNNYQGVEEYVRNQINN